MIGIITMNDLIIGYYGVAFFGGGTYIKFLIRFSKKYKSGKNV